MITAIAHVPDAGAVVTPELIRPGDALVLVGRTTTELGRQPCRAARRRPDGRRAVVPAPDPGAPARYRRLHAALRSGRIVACHDVSEGGVAVAVAEMAIAGDLGATLDLVAAGDGRRRHDACCSPSPPAASSARWPPATSTGWPTQLGEPVIVARRRHRRSGTLAITTPAGGSTPSPSTTSSPRSPGRHRDAAIRRQGRNLTTGRVGIGAMRRQEPSVRGDDAARSRRTGQGAS